MSDTEPTIVDVVAELRKIYDDEMCLIWLLSSRPELGEYPDLPGAYWTARELMADGKTTEVLAAVQQHVKDLGG